MSLSHIPLALKHASSPRIEHFALLSGLEAAVRGTLVSAMPLAVYDSLGSAQGTSLAYLFAGTVSAFWGLLVPGLTQLIPRRWAYTAGGGLYVAGLFFALIGAPWAMALAIMCNAMGTATIFICFNAYILDYVARENLGMSMGANMSYAALPWTIGPLTGVWLYNLWRPAPFLLAGLFTLLLIFVFWWLRLGNGKQISRARAPAVNPIAYLGRFLQQPRLIAGFAFAVMRSCGWWVYIVYLPIFAVESGLDNIVGGIALSISNAFLFLAPMINRKARALSVRRSVRIAFMFGGIMLIAAALLAHFPLVTAMLLIVASLSFVALDVIGGLPFLMAVRPSERTEMSAVYTSYRDVSGMFSPALAWVILFALPLQGVFFAAGVGFLICWSMAGKLHPRLGTGRPSRGGLKQTPVNERG